MGKIGKALFERAKKAKLIHDNTGIPLFILWLMPPRVLTVTWQKLYSYMWLSLKYDYDCQDLESKDISS